MFKTKYIETPVGIFCAQATENHLVRVYLPNVPLGCSETNSNKILEAFSEQLQAYFKGTLKTFNLPLFLNEPPFRTHVLTKMQQIPYGKTCSYQELAIAVKNPKAARAVGQACNKNPLPIVIPCHRIVGAHNQLTGYGGGLSLKQYLLDLERKWA